MRSGWSCLALAAVLIAGCSSPGGTDGPEPQATDGPTGPAPADAPADRLEMSDCWASRAFVPVQHASAQALLPEDLTAASWIQPGDRTFAMLDLVYLECLQSAVQGQESGPASLLLFGIPLEVSGSQSGSNVFPVLAVHTNDAVAAFWDGKCETRQGTLTRTGAPDATGFSTTLLAIQAGALTGALESKVPEATAATGDGSFLYVLGPADARREVETTLAGAQAGLGGSAELVAAGSPVALAQGAPGVASGGFATVNGPLQSIVFLGPAAAS